MEIRDGIAYCTLNRPFRELKQGLCKQGSSISLVVRVRCFLVS